MAFLKKPVLSKSNSHFETIIGSSSRIDGNLSISENIRIDGIINGSILQIEGKQITVAVANGASILGDIRADNIILSGKVVGNLFTQNMVEVLSTAEINGDINYVNISMEAGANIKGQLNKINDSTGVEAATHLVIDHVKQKSSQA